MYNSIQERFFQLSKRERILYIVFFIFFIGYLSTLKLRPYPLSYIVKIIPILSLALIAIGSIKGGIGKLVFTGLLFSAIGDLFLALSGKGFFVIGLSSFAAAHLMYIVVFLRKPVFQSPRVYFVLAFIIYGFTIWSFVSPNLNSMLIPVTIYIIVITTMGVSAALGKTNHWIVLFGAILFIISDSVIAVNMFLTKVQNSSFWIMLTYFPAQFLITYGVSISKIDLSRTDF